MTKQVRLRRGTTAQVDAFTGAVGEIVIDTDRSEIRVQNNVAGGVRVPRFGGDYTSANLAYTGTFTGGTGVINIGSAQFYKDATGNLGIGIVPYAHRALGSEPALDIGPSVGLRSQAGNTAILGNNVYRDSGGTLRYKVTGFAGQLTSQGADGSWTIETAPSGTAGNPITFTQAMTLTQGGNLLVGSSDTGYKIATEVTDSATPQLAYIATNTVNASFTVKIASNLIHIGSGSGTTVFDADGAEGARLTTARFLKASNTGGYQNATGTFHEFNSTIDSTVLAARSTSSGASVIGVYSEVPNGAAGLLFAGANTGVGNKFEVLGNGNVQNTSNSYGAISDAKLKENVVDAPSYLDKFLQVRFRKYNMIGSELVQFGVVAQELETVFPGLVDTTPDFEQVEVLDEETGEKTTESVATGEFTRSVKYSVLAAMQGKVIQEQQALIQDLIHRVAALESA